MSGQDKLFADFIAIEDMLFFLRKSEIFEISFIQFLPLNALFKP